MGSLAIQQLEPAVLPGQPGQAHSAGATADRLRRGGVDNESLHQIARMQISIARGPDFVDKAAFGAFKPASSSLVNCPDEKLC